MLLRMISPEPSADFIPSAQGVEKDMQEAAAVLECTQMDFLTPEWRERLEAVNGRDTPAKVRSDARQPVERM